MDSKQTLYITRLVEFSAAHRLYLEGLSETENFDLFGPCSNPYGHGHNYELEVTIKGEIDPKTQMVVHFSSLKRILQELVVTRLDHRHLNHDVEIFKDVLPTSENIVRILWNEIEKSTESFSWKLHKLKLYSTKRNSVEYYGNTGESDGH